MTAAPPRVAVEQANVHIASLTRDVAALRDGLQRKEQQLLEQAEVRPPR